MRLTVEGQRKVAEAIRKARVDVSEALSKAVVEEATAIRDDERRMVPVVSGDLQRGIRVLNRSEFRAEVGIGNRELIYAVWVEWGRKNPKAKTTPFATPSAELARNRWPTRAVDAVKKAV